MKYFYYCIFLEIDSSCLANFFEIPGIVVISSIDDLLIFFIDPNLLRIAFRFFGPMPDIVSIEENKAAFDLSFL